MDSKRPAAKSFRELIVWQKAHQLVLSIYAMTRKFPKEELYGVTSQLRRSSVSVAANIAEAFKKKSGADKLRILNISQGSLSETEYFLILAQDLEFGEMSTVMRDADEVGKILESYMRAIRK